MSVCEKAEEEEIKDGVVSRIDTVTVVLYFMCHVHQQWYVCDWNSHSSLKLTCQLIKVSKNISNPQATTS